MKITILTMFPEMLQSMQNSPVFQHAVRDRLLEYETVDIREFSQGSYRHIDDSPYGGGPGMILRCEPVLQALQFVKTENSFVVCPVPAGVPYTEKKAHEYASKKHLILIAGHYEGIDARIYNEVNERVSLGDYIVSGGEYACMMIADSVIRLLDGVMKKKSTEDESFENGLLEYPQYTRPRKYNGRQVPDVLLSGSHEEIRKWRLRRSLEETLKFRPDLIEQHVFSEEEKEILADIRKKTSVVGY